MMTASTAGTFPLPICSYDQMKAIQIDLPPDECVENKNKPWVNKCSYTYATNCPGASWIDWYNKQKHRVEESKSSSSSSSSSFVGLSISCNKGYDVINTMRMGSRDPSFSKKAWASALKVTADVKGRCGQGISGEFELKPTTLFNSRGVGTAEMHCVEASPITAAKLQEAVSELRLDAKGFHVTEATMGSQTRKVYFPLSEPGLETNQLDDCTAESHDHCIEVQSYTLDDFTRRYVKKLDNGQLPVIDILSIDIEGYDGDAIFGGLQYTLPKVAYLEFEYNWKGSYKRQSLGQILDASEPLNFVCYWPGKNKLWRITGCHQEFYDSTKHWSNVACVKWSLAPDLASHMEDLFLKTIQSNIP
jgi:FkbM family methyltransferase